MWNSQFFLFLSEWNCTCTNKLNIFIINLHGIGSKFFAQYLFGFLSLHAKSSVFPLIWSPPCHPYILGSTHPWKHQYSVNQSVTLTPRLAECTVPLRIQKSQATIKILPFNRISSLSLYLGRQDWNTNQPTNHFFHQVNELYCIANQWMYVCMYDMSSMCLDFCSCCLLFTKRTSDKKLKIWKKVIIVIHCATSRKSFS